jgi:putative transposase
MSRRSREIVAGATYHVASDINRGDMALERKEIKKMFLNLVEDAKKKFNFKLFNFNIMDNHIHFLIKPGKKESLSKIMQYIKQRFAIKWNRLHKTKGHLWGERFYSRVIEDKQDFAGVFEYIDNNPVKAKLVKKAADWEFSGLFHRLKRITSLVDEPLEDELFFPSSSPLSASL